MVPARLWLGRDHREPGEDQHQPPHPLPGPSAPVHREGTLSAGGAARGTLPPRADPRHLPLHRRHRRQSQRGGQGSRRHGAARGAGAVRRDPGRRLAGGRSGGGGLHRDLDSGQGLAGGHRTGRLPGGRPAGTEPDRGRALRDGQLDHLRGRQLLPAAPVHRRRALPRGGPAAHRHRAPHHPVPGQRPRLRRGRALRGGHLADRHDLLRRGHLAALGHRGAGRAALPTPGHLRRDGHRDHRGPARRRTAPGAQPQGWAAAVTEDRQPLLDAGTVLPYLRRRGLLAPGAPATADELSGGVSSVALAVDTGDGRGLVVKQALPRLRTEMVWHAKRERTLNEAAALALAAGLTPGSVPAVLDTDHRRLAMTIERAPADWGNWKELLLAGRVWPSVAERLGALLGRWAVATEGGAGLPERLDDPEAFDQLRLAPFHRTVAGRHPSVATRITACERRTAEARQCLVHGDFSPKNVLTGPMGPDDTPPAAEELGCWVLDFEVAHLGDPTFDVAFLLCHLLLKSVHLPDHADALFDAARRFLDAYGQAGGPGLSDPDHLADQLACLLLARVDGTSPAGYLTPGQGVAVRGVALDLLTSSDPARGMRRLLKGLAP
ncbi:hypothetical protein EBN88_10200 [Streptomyces triticirhizae]|uniref:Aminoglycoside phosphotransferase domain-containing protein n=1 Tax=Streptomyces triticirhizae TaxID=2483353 RepID=A0A3M2LXT9_9ACTN|nr:hypothetical protein EBN88_10200 [Streptomyces triticirhizae]